MQKGERWRLMRRSSHWVSGRLIRDAYASSSIIYLRALASFARKRSCRMSLLLTSRCALLLLGSYELVLSNGQIAWMATPLHDTF